jgi:hypothetical protein
MCWWMTIHMWCFQRLIEDNVVSNFSITWFAYILLIACYSKKVLKHNKDFHLITLNNIYFHFVLSVAKMTVLYVCKCSGCCWVWIKNRWVCTYLHIWVRRKAMPEAFYICMYVCILEHMYFNLEFLLGFVYYFFISTFANLVYFNYRDYINSWTYVGSETDRWVLNLTFEV